MTNIEHVIGHLRRPFTIKEDGSSQTKLTNHGRVGFHLEKLFGILPNCSRLPDFSEYELKTVQPGKSVTIGTMPDSEFCRIANKSNHQFRFSDPYNKMKNTLVVVYTRLLENRTPTYVMNGWGFLTLAKMSNSTKHILQSDYEFICETIVAYCNSRDGVTRYLQKYGSISGEYLSLVYKGQGSNGYNYPAWKFQSSFMRKLIHA